MIDHKFAKVNSLFVSRIWKFVVSLQTRAPLQSCEVFLGGFCKTLFEYINVYSLACMDSGLLCTTEAGYFSLTQAVMISDVTRMHTSMQGYMNT